MRCINDFSETWRNFLFANGEDFAGPDVDDILTRVDLISSCHEELLEEMLKTEPDMMIVSGYKEEIAFHRMQLEDIILLFAEYYHSHSFEKRTIDINEILDGFCSQGTNYFLYEIAKDWKEWGDRVFKIWDKLNDRYGNGLHYIQNDLCKLIMEEIYESKTEGE